MDHEVKRSRFSIKGIVVSVVVSIVLLIAIFAASVYRFNNDLQEIITQRSHSTILQAVQLKKVAFAGQLANCFAMLNRTANLVSSLDEINAAHIAQILTSEIKSGSFMEMGFADRAGNEYTHRGEIFPIRNRSSMPVPSVGKALSATPYTRRMENPITILWCPSIPKV